MEIVIVAFFVVLVSVTTLSYRT